MNAAELRVWLVERLAELRGVSAQEIDPRSSFHRQGLDSLGATRLIADLSIALSRPLSSTLVWEYTTIESLVAYLIDGTPAASMSSNAARVASAPDEPIAIVGMAGRFPGAPNIEAFWKLLCEGRDAITIVPKDRWDVDALYDDDPSAPGKMRTKWGGFLDRVDEFEPQFFGISPREAMQMDPQQRIMLELAWEALEDAGIGPLSLRDSRTGVFVGAMWHEDAALSPDPLAAITQHTATGRDLSIIAARISYTLGLRGPSIAVNTACSSSLVAMHYARRSLQLGECDVALVGGVNLILSPASSVAMSKFGAMAPDGHSKAFDASANGYVRGEGGGMVVLKRVDRALADGDPIHCILIGSAVNNDGASNGLTAPSPQAQILVLEEAYRDARVDPHDVQFVETHGTGTRLGDPIEAGALGAVLGTVRTPEHSLVLGSVKTNIGHLEAAAGIAGFIKTALAIERRVVPPNLHFHTPSPHIPFEALRLRVPVQCEAWPEHQNRALAGVSSFGFGGTNCHVVVEGPPPFLEKRPPAPSWSTLDNEFPSRGVVFVFGGQGSQWLRMGVDLLREPAFRASIQHCREAMRPHLDGDLLDTLISSDSTWLEDTAWIQPAIFAIQVSLAALLRSHGIEPAAVVGQSMGEVAAAHVAGCLRLEDAVRVICTRSRMVKRVMGKGAMAVVDLPVAEANAALESYSNRLSIAVSTSPSSTVIAGDPIDVEAFLAEASRRGIDGRRIKVDYASHCAQMDALLPDLAASLETITPRAGVVALYSSVKTNTIDGAALDAAYWCENLRRPVLLADTLQRLINEGYRMFVELDPHPLLVRAIEQCLRHTEHTGVVVCPMHRDEPAWTTFEHALSALPAPKRQERTNMLLPLSARGEHALRDRARSLAQWLSEHGNVDLNDIAYTASMRRSHLDHRLAVIGANKEEIAATLGAFAAGEMPPRLVTARATSTPPKVVFVFPGQGSQWVGMGQQLFRDEPTFRDALTACDEAIRKEAGFSVIEELDKPEETSRFGEVDIVQPLLFAIEVALAALWRSWGIEPSAVVGHSMGEVAAAFVAGALSMDDAVAVICRRSRLLRTVSGKGAMALVELTLPNANDALAAYEDRLSVAASNGPRSTVIAGDPAALDEVLGKLEREGVFCRRVNVNVASHSPQMAPLRDELLPALAGISPREISIPMRSTVTGERLQGHEMGAAYWADNLRKPVRFSQVVAQWMNDGATVFLEMSPHPILTVSVEENLVEAKVTGVALASGHRDEDERYPMLTSLAALHVQGVPVDWRPLFQDGGRVVPLPTYPWQRKRYWVDSPSTADKPMRAPRSSTPPQSDVPEGHRMKKVPEQSIQALIVAVVSEVTGLSANDIDSDTSLIRLGVDSLLVMQIRNALRARLHVDLPTRVLFDAATSIRSLVKLVAQQAPDSQTSAQTADSFDAETISASESFTLETNNIDASDIAKIMAEQLRALSELTQRQLQTLAQLGLSRPPTPTTPQAPERRALLPDKPKAAVTPGVWVPYKPIQRDVPASSADYLGDLTRDYCAHTAGSKARTQADRFVFANPRHINGFSLTTKEITYPIIAERAAGSRIWDVDGNEYIDLAMGFGSSLFGHNHPALAAAIKDQMERSWAVGPISSRASDVARRISAMTGLERVAFYNSGTEAVMVALRLARTATGRAKVVQFEGAYHGMSDTVLAVPSGEGAGTAMPMAPGVTEGMVQDTIVLRYDDPASLQVIADRADELAAVLVEPVQSRQPDLQPRAFLHALRELTQRHGIALIFDEMVTGFRILPGGAQAWFAVRADLVTYGKAIGGGMPIGVVAGSARFMDSIDGGMWTFGDKSVPPQTNTFAPGGTFCAHPLSMACATAVLERIADEGPSLHRRLNARTRTLCVRLNILFRDAGLPIHAVNFGSLFRITLPRVFDLFHQRLIAQGVYVWEGRGCFLTPAHTDADVDRVVEVVTEAAQWLLDAVVPVTGKNFPGFGIIEIPATSPQRAMFARCQRANGDRAYHITIALRVRGPLQLDRLEATISELVRRHQSLRTCFRTDGDMLWQHIHPVGAFEIVHESIDEAQIPWFTSRITTPFDLMIPGLLRCGVGEFGPNDWLLVIDMHHLVVDGVSMDRLVEEFFILYRGSALPEPRAGYADFAAWERAYLDSDKAKQDGAFWRALLTPKISRLEFPADFPPEEQRQFEGAVVPLRLSDPHALRSFARERAVTNNVLLNAIFRVFAWAISGQTDVCFGGPTAGRPDDRFDDTIGLFIGTVIYRAHVHAERTFDAILKEACTQAIQVLDAQHFPFERIANLIKSDDGRAPFEVGFSYETSTTRGARQIGDWTIEPHPAPPRGFSMELVVACTDDANSFNMRIGFNPRRFRRETVESWATRFDEIARAVISAPDQPLSNVRGKP